jgi:hypothetical protein
MTPNRPISQIINVASWSRSWSEFSIFTEVHRIGAMEHHASRCLSSSRYVARLNLRRMQRKLICNLLDNESPVPFRPLNIVFLVSFPPADQAYLLTIVQRVYLWPRFTAQRTVGMLLFLQYTRAYAPSWSAAKKCRSIPFSDETFPKISSGHTGIRLVTLMPYTLVACKAGRYYSFFLTNFQVSASGH